MIKQQMAHQDTEFRQYLKENGYDISQLGIHASADQIVEKETVTHKQWRSSKS